MTLGPDDNFYIVNKVSSMGNGFTFDLMTLVLLALTRSIDPLSSVFGDDIICQADNAGCVIDNLRIAGFIINLEKTNVRTGYRESCGSHHMDNYGYVTTFEQRWLRNSHDLIVACNKVAILSSIYGGDFANLRAKIWSCIPRSLLGAATPRRVDNTSRPPSYELDTYIRYGPIIQFDPAKKVLRSLRRRITALQKSGNISVAQAYVSVDAPASSNLRSRDWDLYFQYIRNSRRTRRVTRSTLKSTLVARVDEEQIGFVKALLSVRKEVVG